MKILRRPEVCARTGLSYPTIWRKEKGGAFPKRLRLGPQSVGWLEAEIDEWIASRPRERGDQRTEGAQRKNDLSNTDS